MMNILMTSYTNTLEMLFSVHALYYGCNVYTKMCNYVTQLIKITFCMAVSSGILYTSIATNFSYDFFALQLQSLAVFFSVKGLRNNIEASLISVIV